MRNYYKTENNHKEWLGVWKKEANKVGHHKHYLHLGHYSQVNC